MMNFTQSTVCQAVNQAMWYEQQFEFKNQLSDKSKQKSSNDPLQSVDTTCL